MWECYFKVEQSDRRGWYETIIYLDRQCQLRTRCNCPAMVYNCKHAESALYFFRDVGIRCGTKKHPIQIDAEQVAAQVADKKRRAKALKKMRDEFADMAREAQDVLDWRADQARLEEHEQYADNYH